MRTRKQRLDDAREAVRGPIEDMSKRGRELRLAAGLGGCKRSRMLGSLAVDLSKVCNKMLRGLTRELQHEAKDGRNDDG